MDRPLRAAASLLALLALAACGGSDPPPKEPQPEPAPTNAEIEAPPEIDETPTEVARPEAPAQEADPHAGYRDITPRDCMNLAAKYGELTRSDETAKLNPKLNDKQRAQAAESIDAAARTLESRWADSCEKSLSGKAADGKAIDCAMAAKNVAAFDTCLNGPK